MTVPFRDRREAGRFLAEHLSGYTGREDVVVLALPRGGVPVGYEVAQRLDVPLDVFVVRKLGLPWQPELAMGAIASGGAALLNRALIDRAGVSDDQLETAVATERLELRRRETEYRGGRPPLDITGKTVILVDDGLATGSTMRAALSALGEQGAARLVAAVPVGAPESCTEIAAVADEIVCAIEPRRFRAVGEWYHDFSQTTDDEVRDLLGRAPTDPTDTAAIEGRELQVEVADLRLTGDLAVPSTTRGVVLFAHGSGSSRHSPRNRAVARSLNDGGFATFLVDLLTPSEEAVDERTRHLRFDVGLLGDRLVSLGDSLRRHPAVGDLPLGLFGASTGGGAALVAAAQRPDLVDAVVSRGGRPDLAGSALPQVHAPTLLLVGGRDETVIELNRQALAQMHGDHRLDVVPGATHLFEEPGALEAVAQAASDWFGTHLHAAA